MLGGQKDGVLVVGESETEETEWRTEHMSKLLTMHRVILDADNSNLKMHYHIMCTSLFLSLDDHQYLRHERLSLWII